MELNRIYSVFDEGEQLSSMPHHDHDAAAAEALRRLRNGDAVFVRDEENHAKLTANIRRDTAVNGQHPYAVIVTCADSRVPPEHIFEAGIGELFVIRNAGNVLGKYDLGSIEYAVEHLGCRLVVIMGHTGCGAVTSAMEGGADGYVGTILSEIQNAIGDEKDPRKAEILNVCHSLHKLSESAALVELHREGKVEFAGAIYDIETGKVHFLTPEDHDAYQLSRI